MRSLFSDNQSISVLWPLSRVRVSGAVHRSVSRAVIANQSRWYARDVLSRVNARPRRREVGTVRQSEFGRFRREVCRRTYTAPAYSGKIRWSWSQTLAGIDIKNASHEGPVIPLRSSPVESDGDISRTQSPATSLCTSRYCSWLADPAWIHSVEDFRPRYRDRGRGSPHCGWKRRSPAQTLHDG